MTNPAVLSRKEVDRWCRELIHENKEKDKMIAKAIDFIDQLRDQELEEFEYLPDEYNTLVDAVEKYRKKP